MGNSSSTRKLKISPGEDAFQALSNSTITRSSSELRDNTIFLNESFLSDLSALDDDCPSSGSTRFSELVSGQEESPECLNFKNLHASFLASFISDATTRHVTRSSLYAVVESHRWSVHSQEYVAMCASFILSILKIYGQCIPQDSAVINQGSYLMFHILDELYEIVTKMKRNNWHVDKSWFKGSTCHDCEINQMVFKHVQIRTQFKGKKFCLVCLQFVSMCKTDAHMQLRTRLLEDIYPYACVKCQMRFCNEHHYMLHLKQHPDLTVGNDDSFNPSCCFLCRVPCGDTENLIRHQSTSLEHACRKEIAMELALRHTGVVSVKLLDSSHNAVSEVNTSPKALSIPEMTPGKDVNSTSKFDIPTCNVSVGQYFCSPCSAHVPKANVINHEKGQRHRKSCEEWASLQKKAHELEDTSMLKENEEITVVSALEDRSIILARKRPDLVNRPSILASNPVAHIIGKEETSSNLMRNIDASPLVIGTATNMSTNTTFKHCGTGELKAVNGVEKADSSDNKVEEVIQEYLLTEKSNIQKFRGKYVCTKCFFEGNIYSVFGHLMQKHNIIDIVHNIKMDETLFVKLEEKLHILSSLLTLCVKEQKYNVLGLINMTLMNKLVKLCLDEAENKKLLGTDVFETSNNVNAGQQSVPESTRDKAPARKEMCTSLPVPVYKSVNGMEGISSCTKMAETSSPASAERSIQGSVITDEEIPPELLKLPGGLNKCEEDGATHSDTRKRGEGPPKILSETTEFVLEGVNKEVTDQDVLEAVEDYFFLNEVKKLDKIDLIQIYKCTKCVSIELRLKAMLSHVLGKPHLKKIHKVTVIALEGMLDILAFFELVSKRSEVLMHVEFHILHNAMQNIKEVIKAKACLLSASDPKHTEKLNNVAGKLEYFPPTSKSHIALPENLQAQLGASGTKTNYEKEENISSRNTTVIGNSAFTSLQEEVQKVCAGTDFSDIEMECGTCGIVFQIFNNDIDLSLDMHIQNDPQHSLATAVPLERDAKSMAESSQTENAAEFPKLKGGKASKPEASLADSRMRVIQAVLSLEKKFVTSKQSCYHCSLCSVAVKTDCQIVHHLLSPKHLSEKWVSHHTDKELEQKSQTLSTLFKYKYAGLFLTSAIAKITALRTKLDPKSKEATPSKVSSLKPQQIILPVSVSSKAVKLGNPSNVVSVIRCHYCSQDLTGSSKQSRKSHRRSCREKLKQSKSCAAPKGAAGPPSNTKVDGNPSVSHSSQASSSQPSKKQIALHAKFYCEVCSLSMAQPNRESHLAGKLHKKKLSALLETLALSLTSV